MLLHTTHLRRDVALATVMGQVAHVPWRERDTGHQRAIKKRMESMDQSGSDRDLLTVADAARMLSRSTEQVRRYLREGRLAGRRMGGQWFIERAAVQSFGTSTTREDQFTRKLRPASRVRPLDDVIGIGEGPGSDISTGKYQYRISSLRRR